MRHGWRLTVEEGNPRVFAKRKLALKNEHGRSFFSRLLCFCLCRRFLCGWLFRWSFLHSGLLCGSRLLDRSFFRGRFLFRNFFRGGLFCRRFLFRRLLGRSLFRGGLCLWLCRWLLCGGLLRGRFCFRGGLGLCGSRLLWLGLCDSATLYFA